MAGDILDQALDAGRDAVRALFVAQADRIGVLEAEIEELKRLIARSSNNSSLRHRATHRRRVRSA